MTPLNLPQYNINVTTAADGSQQIFDRLRGKFVALTPEEWVRQHFVAFLIDHKEYPAGLMANDVALSLKAPLAVATRSFTTHRQSLLSSLNIKLTSLPFSSSSALKPSAS